MMKLGKFLLVVFGVLVVLTAAMGVLMNQTTLVEKAIEVGFNSEKPVAYTELGSSSSNPSKLKAMVKGSIYETGEEMTVYGACFDGDGYLIPGSTATFDSWYSSGVQWQSNASMDSIAGSGRFLIHVNMSTTKGTYLTQITCHYLGDTAMAFGEWQNPDWVGRIKTIDDYVVQINGTTTLIYDTLGNIQIQINNQTTTILLAITDLKDTTTAQYGNLTGQINNFETTVQSNFSTTISLINGINNTLANGPLATLDKQFAAVYDLAHSLDYCYWMYDTKDPYYTGTPNTYDFTAVDMSSKDNAWFVTSTGDMMYYNGTGYTKISFSGYDWNGVSAIEANTNYAWIVGTNGSACFYSINGDTPVELTATVATSCEDVVGYYSPALVATYVIANNGDILQHNGTAWNVIGSTGKSGAARMDMLPDNSKLYIAQGDAITVVNVATNSVTTYTQSGATFVDVAAVYADEVYAVSSESPFKVYKFNGVTFTADFTAIGSTAVPTGIVAHNKMDIWVVTNTPGIYYNYNGKQWQFAEYPYSEFIGIVIGFGNATLGMNMQDIAMFSEKEGFTVGEDGLILKYSCHWDERFDEVMNSLQNVSCGVGDNSLCVDLCRNLTNITLAMNASIMNEFSNLNTYLVNMNNTMVARFDALDLTLIAFQTDVNASFLNVNTLLSDLNYTVNFRFDNVESTLTTIDGKIDTMNNTLISNFADVFIRLTAIDNNLTYVQSQITNLNDAMANNFTNVVNLINALDINMANNFTYTNLLITTLSSDMNANFTYTNGLIQAMEQGMVSNFTEVKNMITVLDASMASNFSYTNSMISAIETSMGANFTYTNSLILDMNASLSVLMNRNYDLMIEVNQTANSILTNVTYTQLYLETTLYPTVNSTYTFMTVDIWNKLLGIEATVNQINETTMQINTTVTNIDNNVNILINKSNKMRAWVTV